LRILKLGISSFCTGFFFSYALPTVLCSLLLCLNICTCSVSIYKTRCIVIKYLIILWIAYSSTFAAALLSSLYITDRTRFISYCAVRIINFGRITGTFFVPFLKFFLFHDLYTEAKRKKQDKYKDHKSGYPKRCRPHSRQPAENLLYIYACLF
jgi:hypothetical protein